MLGFDVQVKAGGGGGRATILASFRTRSYGLFRLLEGLAERGQAKLLNGNGYPLSFSVDASELLPYLDVSRIHEVVPDFESARPGGDSVLDVAAIAACDADSVLVVEGWDLS